MIVWAQRILGGFAFLLAAILTSTAQADHFGNADEIQAQSAHDYSTPLLGGSGGTPYSTTCAPNYFLTGVRLRFGAWANNVTALCNFFGTNTMDYMRPYGGTYGGNGGEHSIDLLCPSGMLVRGLSVTRTDQTSPAYVANVGITCAHPTGASAGDITIWQNPRAYAPNSVGQIPVTCDTHGGWIYFAKGIQGRAGAYLDSLGLVCVGFAKVAPAELPRQSPLVAAKDRNLFNQMKSSEPDNRDWHNERKFAPPMGVAGGNNANPPCDNSHQPCRPEATQLPPCPRTPDRPRLPCDPGHDNSGSLPPNFHSYPNPIEPSVEGRESFRANDRVDWCRMRGMSCGAEAATHFCRLVDHGSHPHAVRFAAAPNLNRTRMLGSGELCISRGDCTGFSIIICSQ